MDDHAALLAAIADRPDDDTPRLAFADWCDDHGDAARAAFVRAQVELARTPEWEPLAVACRHRTPEWSDLGAPFRHTLPAFPEGWQSVGWLDPPFRRGFGWRVAVGSLVAWDEVAGEVFRAAPVGALHLRAAAPLDDWRRFAARPWMDRVRELHLEAGSPVEPVRALAAGGRVTALDALHFHVADIPGMDLLVGDALAGPLAANLRELSFRLSSPASLDDLIDVLAARAGRVEALALRAMNLTGDLVRRWAGGGGVRNLLALDLEHNYLLGADRYRALADALAGPEWGGHTLRLARAGVGEPGARALAACPGMKSVRLLDLSRNPFSPVAARALAGSPHLAGLRALRLRGSHIGDQAVRRLVRATFWNNLTELDLRDNPVSDPGARHFLAAPTPPDLTALVLSGRHLGRPMRAALARHYGERVVIEDE